jgi:YggT family protein
MSMSSGGFRRLARFEVGVVRASMMTTTAAVVEASRGVDREAKKKKKKDYDDGLLALRAVVAASMTTTLWNCGAANAATLTSELALDPEGAKAASAFLGPLFAVSTILFIVRIVMTWYPSVPYTKLPWVVAYVPTEPLLKPTRALVPPVGGVDVSPIIWVGMISFMNEILLGKQGLLVLLANKQLG